MDKAMKAFVLRQMKAHKSMTVATVRSDGWPQATTVAYVNDGLNLYFCCDADGQKARNIAACDKVSAAIDHDEEDWHKLQGLSLAARAKVVKDKREIGRVMKLFARKFPALADMEVSEASGLAMVKLVPKVISAINYRKGFGHTDLVRP